MAVSFGVRCATVGSNSKRAPILTKRESTAIGRNAAQRQRSAAAGRDHVSLAAEQAHIKTEVSPVTKLTGEKTQPNMGEVFGPGGMLERCMIGGYEHRRAQLLMAGLVQDAFESRHHVVVEAGTGTGKTLAYLLPAICSGRRVVISTATKSLQEQLYQKDIPFLQKHFAPELKVAVMKGRSNFLCRVKAHQMADQPMVKGLEEIDAFRQIGNWAKLTETGDRAELSFLPDGAELWGKLDARRDTCTGQKCADFNRCFITGMHQ